MKRTKDAATILEYAQDAGRKEGKAEGLVEGRQAEQLAMTQRLLSYGYGSRSGEENHPAYFRAVIADDCRNTSGVIC